MTIDRRPAADDTTWVGIDGRMAACGVRHAPGAGRLIEEERRLSHTELAVAQRLASDGHDVRSLPERPGQGPVSDLSVCGRPVEVKSWLPLDARNGRAPTARSVYNKLRSARDQADTTVLYAGDSGLTRHAAEAGVAHFVADGRCGAITAVRILGDGFDLAWRRDSARDLATDLDRGHRHASRHPDPEIGLGL